MLKRSEYRKKELTIFIQLLLQWDICHIGDELMIACQCAYLIHYPLFWFNPVFYLDKCMHTTKVPCGHPPMQYSLNHKPWTQIETSIYDIAWLCVAQRRDSNNFVDLYLQSLSLILTHFKKPTIAYFLKWHGKNSTRLIVDCLTWEARSNRLNLEPPLRSIPTIIRQGVLIYVWSHSAGAFFISKGRKWVIPLYPQKKGRKTRLFRAHG